MRTARSLTVSCRIPRTPPPPPHLRANLWLKCQITNGYIRYIRYLALTNDVTFHYMLHDILWPNMMRQYIIPNDMWHDMTITYNMTM